MREMLDALGDQWPLALVRSVGVALGLIGASITAPGAAGDMFYRFLGVLGRWIHAVGRFLGVTIDLPARGMAPGDRVLMDVEEKARIHVLEIDWPVDTAARVDLLIEQTHLLGQGLDQMGQHHAKAIAALSHDIETLRRELGEAAGDVRERLASHEWKAQRLSARGLPVIAMSIVLSGVPDSVAANAYIGWALIALAVVVVFLAREG